MKAQQRMHTNLPMTLADDKIELEIMQDISVRWSVRVVQPPLYMAVSKNPKLGTGTCIPGFVMRKSMASFMCPRFYHNHLI